MLRISALALLLFLAACTYESNRDRPAQSAESSLAIVFDEVSSEALGDSERRLITEIISDSGMKVRALLPNLPDSIQATIVVIERNIDVVAGVSGRADAPVQVTIELSSVFPGGVLAAAETATLFHDLS